MACARVFILGALLSRLRLVSACRIARAASTLKQSLSTLFDVQSQTTGAALVACATQNMGNDVATELCDCEQPVFEPPLCVGRGR